MENRTLKKIRSQPIVNGLVRNTIAQLTSSAQEASEWLTSRWRVAGEIGFDIAGHHLKMRADADDAIVNRLFYRQEWESGELQAWSILVERANAVLDVGANTGVYAVLSAAAQPGARIYAFEPHPRNYARLVENVQLNHLGNVETVPRAVGDHTGMVEFTLPADEEISLVSSAVRSFAEAHFGKFKQHAVQQTTIDDFVTTRGLDFVDLVKIDVEYYELSVLRGAERTLEQHGPVLMCEVFDYEVFAHQHPDLVGKISATQSQEVEELLARHGYNFYYVGRHGLLRVADLHSNPDGGSNYVFSRVRSAERFLPWSNPDSVRNLMARPTS